jgi:hypothetical protein
VERFQVKISYGMSGPVPDRAGRIVQGSAGAFDVEISQKEIRIGIWPVWILQIEAEGHEPTFTRPYSFEEGDQELDFSLPRGGSVEGVVLTPVGEPAANAQLAFALETEAVASFRSGEFSWGHHGVRSDAAGRFKLTKPPKVNALVTFHESGWAITPLQPGARSADVHLLRWGRIEGTVTHRDAPVAEEQILLNTLSWTWSDPLSILYNATTDREGRFVFDKVPAGEFVVSLVSGSWQRRGQSSVQALETPVAVHAGELQTINLATSGRSVVARLRAGPSADTSAWTNALAVLTRDVFVPPPPARNDYVSNASHAAAHQRYAHDPAVLDALRQVRTFVGRIAPDGTATFEDIPPGRYLMEAKLFAPPSRSNDRGASEESQVQACVKAGVSVPEGPDASEDSPVLLGEFTLEPL